ncbi:MAG: hypothetical protein OHK0018_14180 [Erythrobacter tepidarius]
MTRPLIISDCDEVLLHMVAPFKEWLETTHGVSFHLEGHNFAEALRWQDSGELLAPADIWRMLRHFFDTEMDSQTPIAGAVEGINTLAEKAEVVILTNLTDQHRDARAAQLAKVGIKARVYTNQGPKGPALKAIIDEYAPTKALFIDDLAQHHASVAEITPHVTRLHLCGEPMIAHAIDCAHKAGHAHSRIDRWDEALPWLLERLEE